MLDGLEEVLFVATSAGESFLRDARAAAGASRLGQIACSAMLTTSSGMTEVREEWCELCWDVDRWEKIGVGWEDST